MVCRKLSHVIGASFTVCFIFAMGLNASAHAQGVWDFDPQKAFDRLPEFIRAVQSEETGQTASEEVRIIREMIAMTSDEAWEKYQVNTKDGSVGWGPFRAGYSQTDFQKELRQLQQTYSSARSEEEFRKAFVTSSRRYLTPDGRAIVMRYIEAIERGQRIAASSREFFTVTSPKATPTAITVAVSCPHMPNGVVYGARIERLAIDGVNQDIQILNKSTIILPYQFSIPRTHKDVITLDVQFAVDGMGSHSFSPAVLTIPAVQPTAEETRLQEQLDDLKKRLNEVDSEQQGLVDQLLVLYTEQRRDAQGLAGQINGLLHAITDSPVINDFTPDRQRNLRVAKEQQIVEITNNISGWTHVRSVHESKSSK
jgi:hypothetical protein